MKKLKIAVYALLLSAVALAALSADVLAADQKSKQPPVSNRRNYRDMRQHTFNEKDAIHIGSLAVSPGGRSVAYVSDENKKMDIFIKEVNSKTIAQKTDDAFSDTSPAFSPDGKKLAFASKRNGTWDLYLIFLTGGKEPRRLTVGRHEKTSPSWSHKGNKIAYNRKSASGREEVWVYNLENGTFKFVTEGENPAYSPTDDTIVFQRLNNKGYFSVWAADDEAKEEVNIITSNTEGYFNPSWSQDATKIIFLSTDKPGVVVDRAPKNPKQETPPDESLDIMEKKGVNIWVVNRDGSNTTRLTDNDKPSLSSPKFSRDGRVYFINWQGGTPNIFSVIPEFVNTDAPTAASKDNKSKSGKK